MNIGSLFSYKFGDIKYNVICEVLENDPTKIHRTAPDEANDIWNYATFKIVYPNIVELSGGIYTLKDGNVPQIIKIYGDISLVKLKVVFPEIFI